MDLVEVYGGAKRFDPNVKSHHHLHCVSCGKILDFQNDEYTDLKIPDNVHLGFTALTSRVVLKGICEQCGNSGNVFP